MRWLIDCYNVLHTTMPPMLAGLDESGLCRTLDRTPIARAGVMVVADGSPKPLGVVRSPVESVELVYSGIARTADDVIIQHIDAHTAPRRLSVVSTDRAIRRAAAARRCRVVTSEQFIHLLCEHLRRGGPGPATGRPQVDPLPAEHVAGWMEEMGVADASPPLEPGPASASQRDLLDDLDWDTLEALERGLDPTPEPPGDPPGP